VAVLTLFLERLRATLLWMLLPLAGWANLATRTAILSPNDLRVTVGNATELATVRGTLIAPPSYRVYENDDAPSWRTLARVRVTGLKRGEVWFPAHGVVAIKTPGILDTNFFAGRAIEVSGVIQPPKTAVAEGLFDYRSYLTRQGIYHELKAGGTNDWQIIAGQGATVRQWSDRFLNWARGVLALGLPVEDEPLRLTWAMALNWQTALTGEVTEPFMQSGTMHIFAISGLHIALIAGILISLFRLARISRAWCGALVVPLIWFYTGATGWQASAIRSTIMMTVIIGGWALRRPGNLLNSLGAAAFLILVWDPQQLFQAGFQLSFLVVFFMALLAPPIDAVRERWLRPDPLLPDELRPEWQKRLDKPVHFLATNFGASLAAWLGSLPVIAWYFHLFTPVSLVANLVVVPLSSLALAGNLGSLVCGHWLAPVTVLFNHSGWFLMACMVKLCDWFVKWPGAYWYVPAPQWIDFAIYYAALALLFSGWLWRPGRRLIAGISMGGLLLASFGRWEWEHSATRITVLSVGSGDAILTDQPGVANDLLIDCADRNTAKLVVRPFLHGQGVNRLPTLALTHGDIRHIGGATELEGEFRLQHIVTSDISFRSPPYRELMTELERKPWLRRHVILGDTIGPWRVMHPGPSDHFSLADDSALVLQGKFNGVTVLLCSDLGKLGQRALFDRGEDLRADIVVTGIPARAEPLNDALLDRIQPRVIIVSCGEYPATERVTPALRERLAKRGVPVFYTDRSGSGAMTFKGAGCRVQTTQGEAFELTRTQ
ncbi:MAG TPA: ComEC/Rec2 family competence protein, partial [Verrucomicrobiae bacterium]|nr:ComEC/Rec2 family competence protein [Verrucomicrobiae bacterium]